AAPTAYSTLSLHDALPISRLGCDPLDVGAHQRQRPGSEALQVEVELLLDENSQHTDGRAPQAERVLGASRLLADGEDARQRVERSEEHTSELQSPYDLVCR